VALSGRELLLVIRATDQASGTVRQIGSALRGLGAASTAAGKQLSASQLARRQAWRNIGAGAAVVGSTGRAVRNFGIVTAAGLGLAAKAYADFNEQASLAATQTGPAVGRTAQVITKNAGFIEKEILSMMKQFPASSQEMSQAAYDIYSSLDVNLSGGMKLLRQFNKASVAGMTPLADVTNAGISVMNAFKMQVQDVEPALTRMFAGVRFGRMTFAEFTQSLNQIVPAFASAGQGFDTMVGSLAFLTRLMPSTRMASTALARLTEVVARKDFVAGMDKAGASIKNAKNQLLPLPDVIHQIGQRFPELRKGGLDLQQFFKLITALGKSEDIKKFSGDLKKLRAEGLKGGLEGTIQARRAFSHMIQNYEMLRGILFQVTKDNNEFAQSFNAQANSMGNRWKTFTNRIRSNVLEIGRDSTPAIMEAAKPLEKLLDWWQKLTPATRAHITQLAVWGGALAIVGGTVASMTAGLVRFVAMFGAIGKLGPLALTIIAGLGAAGAKGAIGFDQMAAAGEKLLGVLGQLISGFMNFASGGPVNFAIATAAGAVALGKLGRSAKGTMGMMDGLAGSMLFVGGTGERSLGKLYRGFRETEKVGRLTGTVKQTGRLSAALRTAGALAVALPGPLKLLAGAAALVGGGMFLWNRHQDAVQKKQKILIEQITTFRQMAMRPLKAGMQLGGLGETNSNLRTSRNNLVIVNEQIKTMNRELAKAPKEQRPVIQAQINNLMQDRFQILKNIDSAQATINRKNQAMTRYILGQAGNLNAIKTLQGRIATMEERREGIQRRLVRAQNQFQSVAGKGSPRASQAARDLVNSYEIALRQVSQKIAFMRARVQDIGKAGVAAGRALRINFAGAIKDFQMQGIFGKLKISPAAIKSAIDLAITKLGRMPTLKELKLFFKAYLDPGSIKNLSKLPKADREIVMFAKIKVQKDELAAQLKKAQSIDPLAGFGGAQGKAKVINVEAKVKANFDAFTTAIGAFKPQAVDIPITAKTAQTEKEKVQALFKPPIPQPINVTDGGTGKSLHDTLVGTFANTITQYINIVTTRINKTVNVGTSASVGAGDIISSADTMMQQAADTISETAPTVITPAVNDAINRAAFSFKPKPPAETITQKLITAMAKAFASKNVEPVKKQFKLAIESVFQGAWLTGDALAKRLEGAESPLTLGLFGSKGLEARKEAIEDFKDKMKEYRKKLAEAKKESDTWAREHMQRVRKVNEAATDASRLARQRSLRDWMEDHPKPHEKVVRPRTVHGLTARDIARDFAASARQMVTFVNNLEIARKRGVPESMLKALADLGVEGSKELALLAHGSQKYINQAVTAWQRGQAAANSLAVAASKITTADFLKDIQMQARNMQELNDLYDRLVKRGLPKEFADMLREAGDESLAAMRAMANATPAEFRKFVAAWVKMQKEVKQTQYKSLEDIKDYNKAYRDNVNDFRKQVKDGFKGIVSDMYEFNKNAMGVLFSGLEDLIAARESFRETIMGFFTDPFEGLDEWMSLQQDALDTAVDTQNQAIQGAADKTREEAQKAIQAAQETYDHLKSEFGPLFSGEWLQGEEVQTRIEWGQRLGMKDLQKDLQAQLDAFQYWRSNLASLVQRGAPQAFIKELDDLGIQAADKVAILSKATDAELQQYIFTWQQAQRAIGDRPADLEESLSQVSQVIATKLVPTVASLTEVLKNNVVNLEDWAKNINSLVGRGLPQALIEQLINMGPQAAASIKLLASMTDTELKNYVALWERGRAALASVANKFTRGTNPEEVLANLQSQIAGFNKWQGTLTSLARRGVPLEVIKSLRELGPEAEPYLEVLNSMTDSQLKEWVSLWGDAQESIKEATRSQFEEQIKLWRQHGSNIAIALVAGIQDEQDLLIEYFTNLFKYLLDPSTAPTPPPAKSPYQTRPRPDGPGQGAYDSTASFMGRSGTVVNMEVYAQEDESLSSTLERASFRMKNRL
jgi:TP901 family phage tail tape measure protein